MFRLFPVAVAVGDGRPRVAVLLQPGPRRLLELVQHLADLLRRRLVLWTPRDHPGRVAVLEVQAVRDGLDGLRIAAQELHLVPLLPARSPVGQQVVGRRGGAALRALGSPRIDDHRAPKGYG